jgi:hypothetical protein
MHKIFYYIKAAAGMQLKQSINDFQSFEEYLFLPILLFLYIINKTHIFELWKLIHGYLSIHKLGWEILFCMQKEDK